MAQKPLVQHQINQRMQSVLNAAQPSLPARPPNPDKLELEAFDAQTLDVAGPLDAREALRRVIANAPTWVRAMIGLRLMVTTWLKWHPAIPKEAFGQFELRPGGRIQDFEISSICTPSKLIAFVQDRHVYVQFEITTRLVGETTHVRLETEVAAKSRTGDLHLRLVKVLHRKVMAALLPGLAMKDPNFPAVIPDMQRAGFRQLSRKKLKSQGLLPEQIMEKAEKLKEQSVVPLVEIPKKPSVIGKLFGRK